MSASLMLSQWKRHLVVLADVLLIVAANVVAFLLRFDGDVPHRYVEVFAASLPVLVPVRIATFAAFGIYTRVWRYTGSTDLRDLVAAAFASSAAFYLVLLASSAAGYPRSILMIDAALLICLLVGSRVAIRLLREFHPAATGKRVLIFGAGDAGEAVLRDMQQHRGAGGFRPIGFVDDDTRKIGRRIHGVRVLGTRRDLPRLIAQLHPDEILLTVPRGATLRALLQDLETTKIPIKTLPSLRDILDGKVTVGQIRPLSVEDLLQRKAVDLAPGPPRDLIAGQVVMVTGAGGSIGAELCRQIVTCGPKLLLLFERHEFSLYSITNELVDRDRAAPVMPIIGDVTDRARVNAVLRQYRPHIIFHAAAHKHVPMMEHNPCEAVKNNILGTRTVAKAASEHGVGRFLLVSTDKAVNPTSVMGATKRVAEMVVQSLNRRTKTRYTAVRFGNVLGSTGSVIPRFLAQIKAGGPVTVTHPEIRRYFMLIPEAVQLVLHAAALAEGGEIFVLEMGEQIPIDDMARNLIRLAGFVPDEEIAIEYTGLRPGEKLYEELVADGETIEGAGTEIRRVRREELPDPVVLRKRLFDLLSHAAAGDTDQVLAMLSEIVPSFQTTRLQPASAPEPTVVDTSTAASLCLEGVA